MTHKVKKQSKEQKLRHSAHVVDLRTALLQKSKESVIKAKRDQRNRWFFLLFEDFQLRLPKIEAAKIISKFKKLPKVDVVAGRAESDIKQTITVTKLEAGLDEVSFDKTKTLSFVKKLLNSFKIGLKEIGYFVVGVYKYSLKVLSVIGLPFVYFWLGLKSIPQLLSTSFSLVIRNTVAVKASTAKFAIAVSVRLRQGFNNKKSDQTILSEVLNDLSEASKASIESFSEFKNEINEITNEITDDVKIESTFRLRPVLGFAFVLFLLILPFKGFSYFQSLDDLRVKILTSSESAIGELFKAGKSAEKMDFKNASSNFAAASNQFASAKNSLDNVNFILLELAKIIPNSDAKLAGNSKNILESGQIAAQIGSNLSLAIDGLIQDRNAGIGVALNNFVVKGEESVLLADRLKYLVSTIDESGLPNSYKDKFHELKSQSELFSRSLKEVVFMVKQFALIVGTERDTRYLLAFQNNSEIRASGGFFGSYALLDFSKGKIKNLEVPAGGTYDVEAAYKERIIAPTPLQMVNSLWHMWDANWWYDWPTTARKLMWFYEKSGGPTVDGVISFTPTVIEEFLRAFGPVDMTKDYGVIITAENFWEVAQSFSEQKPSVTTKPKQIIGDLFQTILQEFPNRLNRDTLFKLVISAQRTLNEKQAMFYFSNDQLETYIGQFGWDGRVKETSQDYLAVINSSVAGGKSDREIDQDIFHSATVMADGSVIDEVKITRVHNAIRGVGFGGQRNVNWLRVYVPVGAELIEATGFRAPDARYFEQPEPEWKFDNDLAPEDRDFQTDSRSNTKIYQELGKTVFANWTMIDPGETKTIYLKYKLPFKVQKLIKADLPDSVIDLFGLEGKEVLSYGLLAQKQPGSLRTSFSSNLNTEPYTRTHPSKLSWSYPEKKGTTSVNGWNQSVPMVEDSYYAILLEEK